MARGEPQRRDQAGLLTVSTDKPGDNRGQLIVDKYGHVHTDAVFRHWSPVAIKALGIRRVDRGGAK